MIRSSLVRRVAAIGALVSTVSLAGSVIAASPPMSSHASPTALTAVAGGRANTAPVADAHGVTVSTAAESDTVGGAHQNHGGYVSCVARGGSDCTSTTPTLPKQSEASSHIPDAAPATIPAR